MRLFLLFLVGILLIMIALEQNLGSVFASILLPGAMVAQ